MNNLNSSFYIEQPLTQVTAYDKAGKTSLAVSLTIDALIHCGKKVLYFSPGKESTRDIRYRMVAAWRAYTLTDMGSILENPTDIRHKFAQDSLLATFKLPLIIRDETEPTFQQFRKWYLWHAHYDKIDLIIVDDFHCIKEGGKMEYLHELQKLANTFQIPCLVFNPLPTTSNRDSRRLSRLNIRLGACAHLGMWLSRPLYEINAELEIIKSIGYTRSSPPEQRVLLSFNPRTGHFEDVENIGMHLTLSGMYQECSF